MRVDTLARSFALTLSGNGDVRLSPASHLVAAAVVLPVLAGVGGASAHRSTAPHIGAIGAHPSTFAPVRVIARDYALQAPDTLRAGRVEFELQNDGNMAHELIVGLVRRGTTSADIVAAHQRGLPLVSGREYVLLCQLRDTVGAPTHAMLGMFRLLHVK